ncbi:MAG: sensor histidine kinase [Pseudomonadales bacterium]
MASTNITADHPILGMQQSRPLVLLVCVPLFNSLFFLLVSYQLGALSPQRALTLVIGFWGIAMVCLVVAVIAERLGARLTDFAIDDSVFFAAKYLLGVWIAVIVTRGLLPAPEGIDRLYRSTLIVPGMIGTLEVLLIAAIRHIIRQRDAQTRLESQLRAAQFEAVKSKLNPHFLFNSLNLIAAEIRDRPAIATAVVNDLADLLRGVLDSSSRALVPVSTEVELIERYLRIQATRFEPELTFAIDVEDEAKQGNVPPFLLQPLVENAITHGFSQRAGPGHIAIQVRSLGDELKMSVADDGVGFDPAQANPGHGLRIVRDTLRMRYGERHQFVIDSRPDHGTTVTIVVPSNS